MCRIVGFKDYRYQAGYGLGNTVEAMRDTLIHGGPDDAGIFEYGNVAFGHRRLSILDLSSLGHQPMTFEKLIITYNGEVYNFKEVRKELEDSGYGFQSDSDTEVILKSFHKWGKKAVHKFRGMFAFAIYDLEKEQIVLCRDRAGVKPLYWYFQDGLFMFASELKAFHQHPGFQKELNHDSLSLFLNHGYIKAPHTIFKNTYKLEPGTILTIDGDQKIEIERYWDIRDYYEEGFENLAHGQKRQDEDVIAELETVLQESFDLRMVSDVPVGVFLSGGIDSSLLTALLQKKSSVPIKTFTIGFEENDYNEADDARKIAAHLGTDHSELYCTPKEAFDIVPRIADVLDEPMGDTSIIPTLLVSKMARNEVKVALSADGGDELFCGYTRFWYHGNRVRNLENMPFRKMLANILSTIDPKRVSDIYKKLSWFLPAYPNVRDKYAKLIEVLQAEDAVGVYSKSEQCFLSKDIKALGLVPGADQYAGMDRLNGDVLSLFMYLDTKTYLPDDILMKVDRATMSVALEGREPFLDHKIMEFAAKMPMDLKYRDGTSKYALKKILYNYLPKDLIEKPKRGFSVPVFEWFKTDLKTVYQDVLSEDRIKADALFDYREVNDLLSAYFNDEGVNHNKLWNLFVFQQWKEKYL